MKREALPFYGESLVSQMTVNQGLSRADQQPKYYESESEAYDKNHYLEVPIGSMVQPQSQPLQNTPVRPEKRVQFESDSEAYRRRNPNTYVLPPKHPKSLFVAKKRAELKGRMRIKRNNPELQDKHIKNFFVVMPNNALNSLGTKLTSQPFWDTALQQVPNISIMLDPRTSPEQRRRIFEREIKNSGLIEQPVKNYLSQLVGKLDINLPRQPMTREMETKLEQFRRLTGTDLEQDLNTALYFADRSRGSLDIRRFIDGALSDSVVVRAMHHGYEPTQLASLISGALGVTSPNLMRLVEDDVQARAYGQRQFLGRGRLVTGDEAFNGEVPNRAQSVPPSVGVNSASRSPSWAPAPAPSMSPSLRVNSASASRTRSPSLAPAPESRMDEQTAATQPRSDVTDWRNTSSLMRHDWRNTSSLMRNAEDVTETILRPEVETGNPADQSTLNASAMDANDEFGNSASRIASGLAAASFFSNQPSTSGAPPLTTVPQPVVSQLDAYLQQFQQSQTGSPPLTVNSTQTGSPPVTVLSTQIPSTPPLSVVAGAAIPPIIDPTEAVVAANEAAGEALQTEGQLPTDTAEALQAEALQLKQESLLEMAGQAAPLFMKFQEDVAATRALEAQRDEEARAVLSKPETLQTRSDLETQEEAARRIIEGQLKSERIAEIRDSAEPTPAPESPPAPEPVQPEADIETSPPDIVKSRSPTPPSSDEEEAPQPKGSAAGAPEPVPVTTTTASPARRDGDDDKPIDPRSIDDFLSKIPNLIKALNESAAKPTTRGQKSSTTAIIKNFFPPQDQLAVQALAKKFPDNDALKTLKTLFLGGKSSQDVLKLLETMSMS